MLLFLIIISVFSTFTIIFYAAVSAVTGKNSVRERLRRISKQETKYFGDELGQSIFTRFFKPILENLGRKIMKSAPENIIKGYERKIIMAGSPYNLSVKGWIILQMMAIFVFFLFTGFFNAATGFDLQNSVLIMLAAVSLSIVSPNIILNKKTAERQTQIKNSLPDVLDLLTVSVEAGLGFDAALSKVVDKMPGPLAAEFDTVLQEIKVGEQKRDALRAMAGRVNIRDITTFVGSIIQADQLGVSISSVLRLQSKQMREKRRQAAKEKAMKAPVKMLIPMVLFIFPTIFAVLIGPVLIRVFYTLMGTR